MVDLATNTVISTITVGSAPIAVAVNPAGTRAYVANKTAGTVSVIDTATNTVLTTVKVGTTPSDIVVSPDGTRVFVTNAGSGTVSKIDPTTNKVTVTIKVGHTPSSIAISPDGKTAYVTNKSDGTVSVITLSWNGVKTITGVGTSPTDVIVSPDNTKAYVSTLAGTVSVINTATNTITDHLTVGAPANSVALSADGATLFVAATNDTVTAIDSTSGDILSTLITDPTADTTSCPVLARSANGTIYQTDNTDNALRVLTFGPANSAPTITGVQVGQPDPATGVVAGSVTASDPDNDQLSYAVSTPPDSALGTVTLDRTTGTWSFTPTTPGLVSAWASDTPLSATFTITVSDAQAATAVPVTATTSVPTASLAAIIQRFGSTPSAVAVGSDGTLYVANSGANTLSIITPTNTTTVTVGRSPQAVTVGSDGRVWVVNSGDSTVTVTNPSGSILRTISVGQEPSAITMGSDGAAYVANTGQGTVTVINPTSYVIDRGIITVGATPTGIATGPDGRIYTANFGDGTISIIDPANDYAVDALDISGTNPYGIAVSAEGWIYVTAPLNDAVTLFRPTEIPSDSGGTVVTTSGSNAYTSQSISVSGAPTAISSGRNGIFYVTSYDANALTVIDPQGVATDTIPIGRGPTAVAVGPDDNVYVSNGGADSITVIDPLNQVVNTLFVGVKPFTVTLGYNGELLATRKYDGSVIVIPKSLSAGPTYTASSWPTTGSVAGAALAANSDGLVYLSLGGYFGAGVTAYTPEGYYVASAGSFSTSTARGHVYDIAVSPNGSVFALLADGLFVHDPTTGLDSRLICAAHCSGGVWNGSAGIGDIAVGTNGELYAVASYYAVVDEETGNWLPSTDRLLVIDSADYTVQAAIPWGADFASARIAVAPNGHVLAVTGRTLKSLDPDSGLTSTVDIGREAQDVAVDANGKIYISNYVESSITVLKPDLSIDAVLPVGVRATQLLTGPNGKVYVGSDGASVIIIDPADYSISSVTLNGYAGLPGIAIDMAAGPDAVYVLAGSNGLYGTGAAPITVNRITQYVPPPPPPPPDPNPPSDPPPLAVSDLLSTIATDKPDSIEIHKVVDNEGTVRMVVYMSGVRENIFSQSGWAARLAMNGVTDPKMAEYIDSYAQEWDPDEIMLVGFSKGGMTAQNYAADHKDKVKVIVTFAAPLVQNANDYNAHALHIEASNDKVPKDMPWWGILSGQLSNPDDRKSLDENQTDNKTIYLTPTGNTYPASDYHNKDNYMLAASAFEAEADRNPQAWGTITEDISRFAGDIEVRVFAQLSEE